MTVGTASSTLKRSTFSHTWEDIGEIKNEAVGRWLYWKIDINIINSSRKIIEPHLSCVNENKIFIKVSIKVQFKVSLFHRFNQSSILGFFSTFTEKETFRQLEWINLERTFLNSNSAQSEIIVPSNMVWWRSSFIRAREITLPQLILLKNEVQR